MLTLFGISVSNSNLLEAKIVTPTLSADTAPIESGNPPQKKLKGLEERRKEPQEANAESRGNY